MVGKKKIACLMTLFILGSILGGCQSSKTSAGQQQKKDKVIKIGISQIVEHPALDSAREGFIEALKSNGFEDGKNIKIDYQNAQGEIPTAQNIAQGFAAQKVDMILAIATPAAQTAFNSTREIPILITAVTDPVKAGLAKSLEKPGTNVTGTSDSVPIEKQFELIKKIVPNAKKIGIIYNTSESNSEAQVEAAKTAAKGCGFDILTSGITNVNDVSQSLNSLLGKIDVLYTPTDNAVASSMPLITSECFKKGIPVIGAEKAHVLSGALASIGIDYFKLGYQTGLAAVEIINGKKPEDVPITTLKDMEFTINSDAVKKLNINIPKDLDAKAEKVTGGVN